MPGIEQELADFHFDAIADLQWAILGQLARNGCGIIKISFTGSSRSISGNERSLLIIVIFGYGGDAAKKGAEFLEALN